MTLLQFHFNSIFFCRPKVTVTGAKNAKLICITDENSIEEPVAETGDQSDETVKNNCGSEGTVDENKANVEVRRKNREDNR